MAGRQQVYLRKPVFLVDYSDSACRREGHLFDRQAGVLGWWIQFEQVKSLMSDVLHCSTYHSGNPLFRMLSTAMACEKLQFDVSSISSNN